MLVTTLFPACGCVQDACAHMSQETTDASRSAPRAILLSLIASYVAGYILLIGLLFCVQVGRFPLAMSDGFGWQHCIEDTDMTACIFVV